MRRWPSELVLSAALVGVLTVWYARVARVEVPASGGALGYTLGIVGFLLMFGAQTLYSLRKRWRGFNWGQTRTWLQAHVVMGLVGPLLVVLHSGGRFHGVAGVALILTLVMVASGFVGRYLYTATPRSLDNGESADSLMERLEWINERTIRLCTEAEFAPPNRPTPGGWQSALLGWWLRWRHREMLRGAMEPLRRSDPERAAELEAVLVERYELVVRIRALVAVRWAMSWWFWFHVPLSGTTFFLVAIHVVMAVYYTSLVR